MTGNCHAPGERSPGTTLPGASKSHPACETPSPNATQTLAMNVASQRGRDRGGKKPNPVRGKRSPLAACFLLVFPPPPQISGGGGKSLPHTTCKEKLRNTPTYKVRHIQNTMLIQLPHKPPLALGSSVPPPATTGHRPVTAAPLGNAVPGGLKKMPCLQRPRPEPDLHLNTGDDHRLAEWPGLGGKKAQPRERKKVPQLGLSYSSFNKKVYCLNIKYNPK